MRTRYGVFEKDHAHFVTSTIVNWLPVFTTAERCDILIKGLEYCRAHKQLEIYGWVILDTHFHAVVRAPDLPRVMADLKRHSAKELLDRLTETGCDWLLHQFEFLRAQHKHENAHQVWQEGFHPQAIMSDDMMRQKLDYVHNNPVKRGLVSSPEHWRYSSAHEFLHGAVPVLRVNEWR